MKTSSAANHLGADASRPLTDVEARILVIDDDSGNLVALEAILAELGQPVVCAKSGNEALRHLLKDDFAVILLDAFMPGMDGYETAALIRARERTRHVPIIFLSAVNKDSGHLVRGYEAGAVDYVLKPVDPLILRSKISVFLELHKRAQEIRRQAELEKRLLTENFLVRAEQRRTEAALERSLAQQSLVIDSLPLALYVASSDDKFRSRRLVGGKLDNFIGEPSKEPIDLTNWIDGIHPVDLPRVLEALADAARSRVFSAEYRLKCRDGNFRWFSDRAAYSSGSPEEQFGILLDVSERRLLEEQLAHSQKMELVGQMTGGIAHDFNNMLSVIIGSLDRALKVGSLDHKVRSRLSLALQAANSCADLTKRLLSFSRRQPLNPRLLILADELARTGKIFERLLPSDIELEVQCPKETWTVYLDPSQLEAAVVNLIVNARDAMPTGGRIRVEVVNRPAATLDFAALSLKEGEYVALTVSDEGCGMPEEVRSRAFEPFFTTKEVGKGTGLGLSSIYSFVHQSGGMALIDSEPGRGTDICLFLPKAPAGAGKPPQPEPLAACPDQVKGLHVLVVEDDENIRELATSMLEELGCLVTSATNGDHAAELFREGLEPAVLFTDCMMPGALDGPALALELRKARPFLPVLFTSGLGESAAFPHGGAKMMFLPKPYCTSDLLEALGRLSRDPT